MKSDSERYVDLIEGYYLQYYRGGRGKNRKNRLEEFYAQLTPHELNLIPTGKKILDAGAGDGLFAKLMEEKGNEVICVELSFELTRCCKEKGLRCINADLYKLPFPDDCFDVIFCRAVIEHLFDPWKFFRESYRVLKKGGYVIITTSNVAFVENRLMLLLGRFPLSHDLKQYTPESVKKAMEDAGFKARIERDRKGDPLWQRILVKRWSGFMASIIAIGEKI